LVAQLPGGMLQVQFVDLAHQHQIGRAHRSGQVVDLGDRRGSYFTLRHAKFNSSLARLIRLIPFNSGPV
jgi:hypothetical protein